MGAAAKCKTNFDDATAALRTFQGPTAVNATHVSVTDVHPNRPTLPPPGNQINKLVNVDDMFQFIQAPSIPVRKSKYVPTRSTACHDG